MQFDLFGEVGERPALPSLELLEHVSADYGPRTGANTRGADTTVAFAVDFQTAGEKLTAKLAGKHRYVDIPYGLNVDAAAEKLGSFMADRAHRSLNVAGNGIYTFSECGTTQAEVNQWVYDVLKHVHARIGFTHIRSGGQTGVDMAGLVAAVALGVPATGLYPKGFKHRLASKQDVASTAEAMEALIRKQVKALKL